MTSFRILKRERIENNLINLNRCKEWFLVIRAYQIDVTSCRLLKETKLLDTTLRLLI